MRPTLLALPLICACRASGLHLDGVVSEEIPTVLELDWLAAGPSDRLWIEYGPDQDYGQRVPADPSRHQDLLGLKPEQQVYLRLVAQDGDLEHYSDPLVLETGSLPGDLPALELDADVPDGLDGGFLVMTHVQSPGAAMVVDQDGDIVWWRQVTDDLRLSRARLSRDLSLMYALPVNILGTQDFGLRQMRLDGAWESWLPVSDAHHDMVELPDGTVTFLVHDPRQVEGQGQVLGDKLVELRPDGTQVTLWSTWQIFDYDLAQDIFDNSSYTHANAVDYLEEDDAYLVGLLGLSTIVRIDRATGQVDWVLGSELSDFTTSDGDARVLDHHHQMDPVDGGLLVFENGPSDRAASRAVELALDPETGLAEEVWSYWPEPDLYTYSMGSVQRLESGRTVVAFSVNGQIDIVDPGGERVWRLSSGVGGAFGYAEWVPSLVPRD